MGEDFEMEIKDIPGHEDVRLIKLSGTLNFNTTEMIRKRITSLMKEDCFRIIADVSKVEFCDSRGILIFIDCHIMAIKRRGYFRICNPNENLRGLLSLLGFSKIISIYDTLEAALKEG